MGFNYAYVASAFLSLPPYFLIFSVVFRVFSRAFLCFLVFFTARYCTTVRFFLLLPLVTVHILVITLTLPLAYYEFFLATILTMDSTLRYYHYDCY